MKKRGAINVEDCIDGSDGVENIGVAVDCDSLGDNVNDVKNNSDDHHNINHSSVTDDDNNNNLNVSIKIIDSNVKTNNALHQNNSKINDNSSTKAKKSKKSKKNSKEEIVHNHNSFEIIDPLFDAKHVVDDDVANDDNNDGGNRDYNTLSNDNNSIVIMDEIKNSNSSSTIISSIKGKQSKKKTNNNKINNSSSIIKMNNINIADSNNDINNSHQVNVVHKGRQLIAFGIPVAFNKKMFRTIATLGCPKTEVELLKEVR